MYNFKNFLGVTVTPRADPQHWLGGEDVKPPLKQNPGYGPDVGRYAEFHGWQRNCQAGASAVYL